MQYLKNIDFLHLQIAQLQFGSFNSGIKISSLHKNRLPVLVMMNLYEGSADKQAKDQHSCNTQSRAEQI